MALGEPLNCTEAANLCTSMKWALKLPSTSSKGVVDISRTPQWQDQDTSFLGELAQKEHTPQTSPILTSVQGQ